MRSMLLRGFCLNDGSTNRTQLPARHRVIYSAVIRYILCFASHDNQRKRRRESRNPLKLRLGKRQDPPGSGATLQLFSSLGVNKPDL